MKIIGCKILFLIFFYSFAFNNVLRSRSIPSSAKVGQSWKAATERVFDDIRFSYGANISAQMLLSTTEGCIFSSKENYSNSFPYFGFGFIDSQSYYSHPSIVGVFVATADTYDGSQFLSEPVVVWSANEDHPIGQGATLDLTAVGDLVLKDGGGHQVWSTNTTGRSVRSLSLTCEGNLILVNDGGGVVWQSFDHPTDTWLLGQTLRIGQRLNSRESPTNFSTGFFYATVMEDGLHAFVDTDPPSEFSMGYWLDDSKPKGPFGLLQLVTPDVFNLTYLRLEPDGHLQQFTYGETEELVGDVLQSADGHQCDCAYPTTCGTYGICYGSDSCDCPRNDDEDGNYFNPKNFSQLHLGCNPVTPLLCQHTHKLQTFLRLENVTYFGFKSFLSSTEVDVESCKKACLENCSCAAAIFHYSYNLSSGDCSLPSELLTLRHIDPGFWGYYSTTFIKVQRPATRTSSSLQAKLVPSVLASFFFLIVLSTGARYYITVSRRKTEKCPSDLMIDTVTRFSFETLRVATLDFHNRLGRGGFGSVFEGTLEGGKKAAVKCLESVGQGRKEFLTEVNIIGTLNHFNLVKLIGFCEEGLHRLLVYEYMHNGSLDKWIFNQDLAHTLTWSLRQNIIFGIAKGLEYLHENCNQKVIHFDIKPQNILLDVDFNVKISDFGLAKMIDREQAQVMTIIRGTPGYIAPELISGRAISVKVDVYSFGVLALEIVCGRKNVGLPEEECLTNLVKLKADEDRLADLVDMRTEDLRLHTEEAVKMMKIGIWCLQPHFIRPTMSMVVKVLQDLPNMETLMDLSYLTITHEAIPTDVNPSFSTRPTESVLSGPR